MTEAMTPAERQAVRRKRLREQGFAQRNAWVHKDDRGAYDSFLKTLRKPESDDDTGHNE